MRIALYGPICIVPGRQGRARMAVHHARIGPCGTRGAGCEEGKGCGGGGMERDGQNEGTGERQNEERDGGGLCDSTSA